MMGKAEGLVVGERGHCVLRSGATVVTSMEVCGSGQQSGTASEGAGAFRFASLRGV